MITGTSPYQVVFGRESNYNIHPSMVGDDQEDADDEFDMEPVVEEDEMGEDSDFCSSLSNFTEQV